MFRAVLWSLVRSGRTLGGVFLVVRPGGARLHVLLSGVALVAAVAAIAYATSFKVMDRDFWWHVKAGELMLEQRSLITVEPFAYTREGQPYLARYEWLAQIVLFLVFRTGGPTGVVLFRTAMVLAAFLVLLFLDRKNLWPNVALAIVAANVARLGFLERPQLFTYLFLAADIALAFHALGLAGDPSPRARRRFWLLGFAVVLIQILWVNAHGAASILGWVVIGAAALQQGVRMLRAPYAQRPAARRLLGRWVALGLAVLVATFVSPNHIHNFTYVVSLLTDRTIAFIYEWQPRPFGIYLWQLWPLWAAVLLALRLGRRHLLFSLLVIAVTGGLSLRALRHEMLFAFAATGITIAQLRGSARFQGALDWLAARRRLALLVTALGLFFLGLYTHGKYQGFVRRDHLHGYGVFDLARGAVDFLERENVQGHMFNTYGIGGYLLNRGYPDRKVYVDGRNVDYGFEFLAATFLAGTDPERWRELEDRYEITYAVVDYDAIKRERDIPYSQHLDTNDTWALVFLDDWVAIYLKRGIRENDRVIQRLAYEVLRVVPLEFGRLADGGDAPRREQLETELVRAVRGSDRSIKARLALARLYTADRRFDDAGRLLQEVVAIQPYRPEVHAGIASLAVAQERWGDACRAYGSMTRLAGEAYPDINFRFIADTCMKAGRPWAARWFRGRAWLRDRVRRPATSPSPSVLPAGATTPPTDGNAESLLEEVAVGMAEDVQKYNDEGIAFAERKAFAQAEEAFKKALMLDPGNPQMLNNLGALFLEQGKLQEAREHLERALERSTDYADAHYNLALTFFRLGDIEEARAHAQRSTELGRDASGLLRELK